MKFLNQPFDINGWTADFKQRFQGNFSQRAVATLLDLPNNTPIKEAKHFADITVNDKRIALITLQVKDSVMLNRNRIGIRQSVFRLKEQQVLDGLLVWAFHPHKKHYRLSFIASDNQYNPATDDFEAFETAAKRYTFVLGEGEVTRTAALQLQALQAFSEWTDWLKAFSVEPIGNEFFAEYKKLYAQFNEHLNTQPALLQNVFGITDPNTDEARKPVRDFVKKMMGRITFLYFLQRKGWLGCPIPSQGDLIWEGGNPNFLHDLFKNATDPHQFYRDELLPLFYNTMNNPDRPQFRFGDTNTAVPYLNGGLFEKDTDDESPIAFPAHLFQQLFDCFNNYNFTIDENSPNDAEIGIDPEMLGRIFENLLEDNKDKGAYYTPKMIVEYMCRESIAEYLKTHFAADLHPHLHDLIHAHRCNNALLPHATQIAERLHDLNICDPAIGSGAFPMGILHELVALHRTLADAQHREFDFATTKRTIIQNVIYGVDLERGAVDIARLRFWLSLVVDENQPEPLPNLDFKIMQGNSLIESFAGVDLDISKTNEQDFNLLFSDNEMTGKNELIDLQKEIHDFYKITNSIQKKKKRQEINQVILKHIKKIFDKKRDEQIELLNEAVKNQNSIIIYSKDTNAQRTNKEKSKERLQKQIRSIEKQLTEIAHNYKALEKIEKQQHHAERPYFLWHLWFGEVFDNGGFDIVIGNPPYVRADNPNIAGLRTQLLNDKSYLTLWEKWDLYVAFIEKGYHILAPKGIITYIIPDAYMASKYAERSHDFFIKNATVSRINFLADLKVFDAAVRNIIIQFKKEHNPDFAPLKIKHSDSFENQMILPTDKQSILGDNAFKINSNNEKLGNFDNTTLWEKICYVSYGLRPSSDERFWKGEFTKEDLIADIKDDTHPCTYIEGKWIKKYNIQKVKYLEWGTDRSPRKIVRPTFPELYTPPKIFLGGMTGGTYDETGILCNHSCTVSVLWNDLGEVQNLSINNSVRKDFEVKGDKNDLLRFRKSLEKTSLNFHLKYLLAVLNSTFGNYYLNSVRRSQIGFYPDDLKQLPIKNINLAEQQPFITLVDYLLHLHTLTLFGIEDQVMPYYFEQIIDGMVYELYFEAQLKAYNRCIIEHLGELPTLQKDTTDAQKIDIIRKVYTRLNAKNHPVYINLFHMDSIEEIGVIGGKHTNK